MATGHDSLLVERAQVEALLDRVESTGMKRRSRASLIRWMAEETSKPYHRRDTVYLRLVEGAQKNGAESHDRRASAA